MFATPVIPATRRESSIPGRSGSLGEQLIDLIDYSEPSADSVLDPAVLDHPRTRAFSTGSKTKAAAINTLTWARPFDIEKERVCVRACVYVSCSARAQDDHFQDTTFSIASGFTLTSLRLLCTYHDHDSLTKSRNHLLFCRPSATQPAKPERLNLNTRFTASSLYHTYPARPSCCGLAL